MIHLLKVLLKPVWMLSNRDVIAAQDMGAAGLICSSAEMAANEKLGISID